MTIYVTRGGENIAASVLYNFRKACNVIVLRLHKTFISDQDDLIFLYNNEDKKWTEFNQLEEHEPLFYQQVLERLKSVFSEAEKNMQVTEKPTTKESIFA
jgi:hypothetical protein